MKPIRPYPRTPAPRILAAALALVFSQAWPAWALPEGHATAHGVVEVGRPEASRMVVRQTTDKAIVNWQGFSIGVGEQVRIEQPGAASAILNRVTGTSRSDIQGRLDANGKVFLINPNGVVFGEMASVNVGSLVASTLDIDDADFTAGRHRFKAEEMHTPAAVRNAGQINAAERGTVALMGGKVANDGTIRARLGTVALAAGEEMTLDLAGDGLSRLTVSRGTLAALVENGGAVIADGGQVWLSARALAEVSSRVVNQTGVVRARGLSERGGRIVLDGGPAGVTEVSGVLDASSQQAGGGEVQVLGQQVAVSGMAMLDASGTVGGGAVLIGGDDQGRNPAVRNAQATYVGQGASVKANATVAGAGGKVVVWSDKATRAHGRFSARGGPKGGDGGLVETSGAFLDVSGARVDAAAVAGKAGAWLLDPTDIDILPDTEGGSTNVSGAPVFEPTGSPAWVFDTDISAVLTGGTSVEVRTGDEDFGEGQFGDLTMRGGASIVHGGDRPVSLTLSAHRDIRLEEGARIAATGPGALAVNLNAGLASDGGAGAVSMVAALIQTNGGDLRIYGQSDPTAGFARGRIVEGSSIPGVDLFGTDIETGAGAVVIRGEGPRVGVEVSGGGIRSGGALDLRGLSESVRGLEVIGAELISGSGSLTLVGVSQSDETAGLLIDKSVVGGVGQQGNIVLRAGNDGTVDSIELPGSTVRTAGVIAIAPGNLVSGNAQVLASDAVRIGVGAGEGFGMQLDEGELAALQSGARWLHLGTETHVGRIDVDGSVGDGVLLQRFNLSLQNEGSGAEGIALSGGGALAGRQVVLASAGPIEIDGPISAGELFLRGVGEHALRLTDPANAVDQLAVDPPDSFSFVNSGDLVLAAPGSIPGAAAGGVTELSPDPDSSSYGDFFVRTLTGTLTLGQSITTLDAGSNITLVSAGGFVATPGAELTPGTGGRWQVWASTWGAAADLGDLGDAATRFYGCSYTDGCVVGVTLPATGNLFVFEDQPTLSIVARDVSLTYGDPIPVLGYEPTVSGLVNGDLATDVLSGALGTTAIQGSPVGSYVIDNSSGGLVSLVGYLLDVSAGTLTIDPATLLVTVDPVSRLYGAANPAFSATVSGFVFGETLASATTGTLMLSTLATERSPVGQYAVTPSGLSARNYVISSAGANAQALTIDPATLLITVDPVSRPYGAANPAFSATVSGFLFEDTLANATTGTLAFATPATERSPVGQYAVTPSGLSANNYVIASAGSNAQALTIGAATLLVTVDPVSRLYGAANPAFSATVSGFLFEDTLANATTGTLAFATPATERSPVGQYAVTPSGLSARNYVIASADSNAQALTIDPATLLVTVDPVSRLYGAANPAFSATVSGFLFEDTLANATTGTLAFATPATERSPVGQYAVMPSGLSARNYVIASTDSNAQALTIDPATLTYVATAARRPYGIPNPSLSGTVRGFVAGDTLETATRGTLAFASPAGAFSPPGAYAIEGSGLSARNYLFEQAPENRGALTVTAHAPGAERAAVLRPTGESSRVYERNFGLPPMCFAGGPLIGAGAAQAGDVLAMEWSRVRSRPNLSNCIGVDERNPCSDF